ncbi:MAG: MazG-like family protein [Clostridiales bacterium]|nr:MazG-like family protein [Clostridiales bacterium]
MKEPQIKTLALPRLNGLKPTLESTALKLMEEAGELAEAIGKLRSLSGEPRPAEPEFYRQAARELLDVAQTAITMMFVLEEQHQVDVGLLLREHLEKLRRKGYLDWGGDEGG